METALFKKLLGESAKHFLLTKHNPTYFELLDEVEKRGNAFCKKQDLDFKDTLSYIQLQRFREMAFMNSEQLKALNNV